MMFPPLIARVSVRRRFGSFRLWLPLFLVWALLLVLLAPFLLLGLLVALVVPARWSFVRAVRGLYAVLCDTRGTHVEIEGESSSFSIALH